MPTIYFIARTWLESVKICKYQTFLKLFFDDIFIKWNKSEVGHIRHNLKISKGICSRVYRWIDLSEGWTAIGIKCTPLWNYAELFWNYWNYLEIFGISWKYLELLGNFWNYIILFFWHREKTHLLKLYYSYLLKLFNFKLYFK